jgi:putative integral membrane protein (TIGR02587 family)
LQKLSIIKSLKEYARGLAGGLLFSLPLLFTMELWWAGFTTNPLPLVACIVVTYILLLGYNRYAGLRATATWGEVAIDSVEEMGIGFIVSFLVLLMLKRIDFGMMSLPEIMGKTILEGMMIAIGVSVGTAQLGISEPEELSTEHDTFSVDSIDNSESNTSIISQSVLAVCGSILVGGNIAPTDEVEMLAVEATPLHLLFMVLMSLIVSSVILFFSDFKGTRATENASVPYQITFGTCLCYTIAFLASALVLWFFGRFDSVDISLKIAQCIVLSVPATMGASAGSLLIK